MLPRLFAPAGFRGRLLAIFLAISTLPLAATAVAFFYILNGNAEAETQGKLAFVRDAKRSEVLQYLNFSVRQAENLTTTNAVRYAIGDFYGFSYAFRQIDPSPERAVEILRQAFGVGRANADGTPATDPDALLRTALEYANAHNQFHDDFAGFVRSSEFDNIYLVNAERRVVYAVGKDGYLGAQLDATARGTPVAAVVDALLAPDAGRATVVRDFARDPVTGAFAAYVATRVEFYHRVRGAVVFRLPVTGLDRIVQSESGATGGLYLLNGEQQVLSAPPQSGLAAGETVALARAAMDGISADTLPVGLGGVPALAAWTPLGFLDASWTLAAEVPTAVAFADSEQLQRIVLLLAALSLPVLLGLAVYLSRMMTTPLNTLTNAAEAIAEGDLERAMPSIDRPSELKRLTRSFLHMRDAVREQLGLISEKNVQLEEQVRLIEQKNAELEETDRLKDTFLANTSHELRTPLNGIIGISETLSAGAIGDLSSEQRSQLQLITFSARRLSRLVDDLLDLYRIRQNQMRLDIHPVHVAGSIRNVLQLSEPLLRGEPVTLRVDVPEAIPYVQTDPVRFEQILYNLLGNAIKYTDQGSILIFAEAEGDRVAISVEDTGCGISDENLERIFQPLEQADRVESSRKYGGTGLGLTIARQLATVLGGELVATSTLGQGSRFTVRLPAAATPADALAEAGNGRRDGYHDTINAMERGDPQAEQPITTDAPLIVVVDDEPINLQVLRNVLLPQGYLVRSADNGPGALELIERTKPDLVILDVMMPEMSGLEVARRLRDRYSLLDLPIIMVTARSRTRDLIAGFEHGANDYVVKPFVKDELLARIAMLLEAGRARGRARENAQLRTEIERRVQVEDALRLSQRRLAGLLDSLQAGLVCVNDAGVITYVNRAAAGQIGTAIRVGATPISEILPPAIVEAMQRVCGAEGEVRLDNVRMLGVQNPSALLHAFELDAEAGGGFAIVMAPESGSGREEAERLITSVKGAVDSVDLSPHADPDAEPADAVPAGADKDLYRITIVEVMALSLSLWQRISRSGKIGLAEQSGIWRVNLDRSSLQTRTLDKYLLIETLPLNPRWRDVIRTAEFVLKGSEAADPALGPDRDQLRQRLALMRELLRQAQGQPPAAERARRGP